MTAPRAAPAFRSDFEPRYGEVERVAPGIRRILAHNPSKYSAWGTGTYLIGGDLAGDGPGGPVAVIDPGPNLDSHHRALDAALEGEDVIIEPFAPMDGLLVAFFLKDEAVFEYMQFREGATEFSDLQE